MASADQGHTTATLVLTASTALAAGAALGTLLASRELQTKAKRLKKSLLTLLGSHPTANGLGSPTSSVGGSMRGEVGPGVKMAVILREDADLPLADVVRQAAMTVLGMFKKLYKRRDPLLKAWEASGSRMAVLAAANVDDIVAAQAAARAAGLATHTFAGTRSAGGLGGQGKARTLMVVGPGEDEVMAQVAAGLVEL